MEESITRPTTTHSLGTTGNTMREATACVMTTIGMDIVTMETGSVAMKIVTAAIMTGSVAMTIVSVAMEIVGVTVETVAALAIAVNHQVLYTFDPRL